MPSVYTLPPNCHSRPLPSPPLSGLLELTRTLSPLPTLALCQVRQRSEMEMALFKFHSNRFTVQPLRLATNNVAPSSTSTIGAFTNYHSPLALAAGGGPSGGPLVPVYERLFANEKYDEEAAPPQERQVWTLYGSIWGPRCEWCDGKSFFDHDAVLFERFAVDWQRALRLGVARMIGEFDADAKADDDGDGVPDEVGHAADPTKLP